MCSVLKHYINHTSCYLAEVMDEPDVQSSDTLSFKTFALRIHGPRNLQSNFKRETSPPRQSIPILLDFSDWLEFELEVHSY